ncbi:BLUF domain-containing protein [Hymenobacter sp. BRD128]|uniref:BLUF domain-containing protein n=1 Tax=Hymenobacter sp. BRD128 TaxID=2675878 RepID=UPI001565025D|nr:BLUF domain-containing protein [Hymenobacter sp. BRD128]QKG55722.1 BLUF domain-containing protein [Hymenobacter sp. BRD128]
MKSEPGGCYSIVYISTAIADFREADLLQLLKQARGFNEQAGITGVLMYSGGRFIQVLEGCPAAVRRLFARIAADPRHGCLEKLADGRVPQREYKEWYMSFAPPPTAADWRQLPGYLTPPQLVLAGLGTATQPLLSEFLAASTEMVLV